MFKDIDIADDIKKILMLTSNYIVQTIVRDEGILVKVGNTANKQAGIVNITTHRKSGNNKFQDKLLAVKLAYRLHKYLKSNK